MCVCVCVHMRKVCSCNRTERERNGEEMRMVFITSRNVKDYSETGEMFTLTLTWQDNTYIHPTPHKMSQNKAHYKWMSLAGYQCPILLACMQKMCALVLTRASAEPLTRTLI